MHWFNSSLTAVAIVGLAAVANAEPGAPMKSPELSGLNRVAATLQTTLDVYRQALIEVAVATRRVTEAGHEPTATTKTLLPPPAAEVFARLALSIPRRVPGAALPAVSRAYHVEVVDAFERLGHAETLADVRAPLADLTQALGRIMDEADEIVDLFSRARPVESRIVDPNSTLDEITEALDELGRAEAAVERVQAKRQSLGTQLQAFLRLEVALGHALDLIATAQEAGIHLGFEVQLSTTGFTDALEAIRRRLAELVRLSHELERAPRGRPTGLSARAVVPEAVGAPIEVHLVWDALLGSAQPAALRIYRWVDDATALTQRRAALMCASGNATQAEQQAREEIASLPTKPELIAEIAPGRSTFTDTVVTEAPWRYRVVAASPFGAEGAHAETSAVVLAKLLSPPPLVLAELVAVDPSDERFYRGFDQVRIHWEPSPHELPKDDSRARRWAEEQGLPVLQSYRILRLAGEEATTVALVEPGTHEAFDRPSQEALAHGVAYYVESVGGAAAVRPQLCTQSELQVDLALKLRVAQLGMAALRHPTEVERQALEQLKDPAYLTEALKAFLGRSENEREALLDEWWQSLTVGERTTLLGRVPELVTAEAREAWLANTALHIAERDLPWVITETWLGTQPPYMQREIDRFFDLLDQGSRNAARRDVSARWNAAHRFWAFERLQAGDRESLRPIAVWAWWQSRDELERNRLHEWWNESPPEVRRRRVNEWMADAPPVVQTALRWPDWDQRTPSERQALLTGGWREMPDGLYPHFLAWLRWRNLNPDELVTVLLEEVSAPHRLAARLRWALRPLDVKLAFSLPVMIFAGGILLPASSFFFLRKRSKRRPYIR